MIQELLFGGSTTTISSAHLDSGERNKAQISNNNGGIIAKATATAATKNPSDKADVNPSNSEQNLRCPRCDSSNTKFCYYNNYNLTQPRHFCKTCRRYWTKGGALRNVPIGGGCRKNKTSSFTGTKPKVNSSSADILLKSGLLLDNCQGSSLHQPMMWPSPLQPQTSHLMAFLRSTQNPNPTNHTYFISSSPCLQNNSQNQTGVTAIMNSHNSQTTSLSGFDYPCSSFFGNKNQTLTLTHPQLQQQVPGQQISELVTQQVGGFDQESSGIQELYQKMNLSTNNNTDSYSTGAADHTNDANGVVLIRNGVSVSSSPTSSKPVLESAQVTLVGGGISDSGFWNVVATQKDYSTWITNDHNIPGATN